VTGFLPGNTECAKENFLFLRRSNNNCASMSLFAQPWRLVSRNGRCASGDAAKIRLSSVNHSPPY
jgi:hypothetical protein